MVTFPPLARGLSACALQIALLASGPAAWAGTLGDQVFQIEARYGSDPVRLVEQLRPLQPEARLRGGDELRIFLAAWGYAHAATDKPAVAEAAIDELTELAERTRNDAALASAYALKATLLQMSGQVRAAYGWITSARPLAQRTPSPDLHYWVHMTTGDLAVSNGQIDDGLRAFEAAVSAARATRNPRREAQAYQALAPLRLVRREIGQALDNASRVRTLGEQAGDPWMVVSGWVIEALIAEADGRRDQADQARRAMSSETLQADLARRMAAPVASVNSQAGGANWLNTELDALLQLASLHLSARNFQQARDYALRARQRAEAEQDSGDAAVATLNLGLAELGLGQRADGKRHARDGLAVLARRGRDAELLIQMNRYANALERAGDTAEAMAQLRESLLLETELTRHDRQSTVVALQRESSFQQTQRHMERLEHENALQSVELSRRQIERTLVLLLGGAMAVGGVVVWRLYRRARESNRRLAMSNEELEYASTHDAVTGLLNRRAMDTDTAAFGEQPYCYVTISVKQFGLIVGSMGHQTGDVLLCLIANRLNDATAQCGGRLYRIDGVTFGALLPFGHDTARLCQALEALTSTMATPFEIGNQDLMVAIGVGASEYPKDGTSADEVARLAELAKLQAQSEPGSSHVIYEARLGDHQRDKLRMEARMQRALEHGDFEVFYQGQRELRGGQVSGFEALLRWHDQDKMISPAQFIPLAEESGLIVRIGTWVLRQSCLQAKAWADAGLGQPKVAVNISPRQFNHPEFLATVRDTLQSTGVDPAQIELEITEGSVMNDAEASIAQLHALRAMGLHLAIDDFGTGYASLSYLRRFPLNRLKIDRSFIMQLAASEQDDTIVRTVIELAHSLGLSVTAEGVETVAQESLLKTWGCDIVQGFLHSRPSPAATATALLVSEAVNEPGVAEQPARA